MTTSFYRWDGTCFVCQVCQTSNGHTTTCPVDRLDDHVRDLVAHIGAFVADIQETLTAIGQLLSDGKEP